jgi:hypothetical protein
MDYVSATDISKTSVFEMGVRSEKKQAAAKQTFVFLAPLASKQSAKQTFRALKARVCELKRISDERRENFSFRDGRSERRKTSGCEAGGAKEKR